MTGLFTAATAAACVFTLGSMAPFQAQSAAGRQADAEFEAGAWRADAPGVVSPVVERGIRPRYTAEGLRAKIEGVAGVEVVVMPDGTVSRARIVQSVDEASGLDAAALDAAREWTFEPGSGTLNGTPVPVIVRLNLEFRIHGM